MLLGRDAEKTAIDRMLSAARENSGGALLLVGEAGSGKSALLADAARRAADDMLVLSTCGVESEAPLAFAALQRLLHPLMDRLDAVPAPQARALRVVFGEEVGDGVDRFLVFMGALSLLAAAAETAPVLTVIDDAQWLDDASSSALQCGSWPISTISCFSDGGASAMSACAILRLRDCWRRLPTRTPMV